MAELETARVFCERNGIRLDDEAADRLAEYVDLLVQFNASVNLIGPLDRPSIWDVLIIDSLAAAAVTPIEGAIVDVGSGAGLPGIPLAVVSPAARVTLVEPRRKRVTFLEIARKRLELEDRIDIVDERVEDVDLAGFDVAVSKAFRRPAEWVAIASGLIAQGATIVCLHASSELEAIEAAAGEVGLASVSSVDRADLGAPETDPPRSVTVVR